MAAALGMEGDDSPAESEEDEDEAPSAAAASAEEVSTLSGWMASVGVPTAHAAAYAKAIGASGLTLGKLKAEAASAEKLTSAFGLKKGHAALVAQAVPSADVSNSAPPSAKAQSSAEVGKYLRGLAIGEKDAASYASSLAASHASLGALLDASHSEQSLSTVGVKRGHVAILLASLPKASPLEPPAAIDEVVDLPSFAFGTSRPSRFGPSALKFPADVALPLFTFGKEKKKKAKAPTFGEDDDEDFDFGAAKKEKKKKKAKEGDEEARQVADDDGEAEFDFGAKKEKKKKKAKEDGEEARQVADDDGEAEFDFGEGKKKKKKAKEGEETAAEEGKDGEKRRRRRTRRRPPKRRPSNWRRRRPSSRR